MAIATKVIRVDNTGSMIMAVVQLTVSGNYGTASSHGDIVNLSGIDSIKSKQVPVFAEIREYGPAGTVTSGYNFLYTPGTTLANGQMQIMGTPGVEFPEGTTYASGSPPLTTPTLILTAWFLPLI